MKVHYNNVYLLEMQLFDWKHMLAANNDQDTKVITPKIRGLIIILKKY